jgi:MoaA/NifB/PqqE/SkfB family radical SAM enzyme
MCDSWKREPGEELKPDEYSRLPKSLKFINISGGEPFLRDDLPQIIKVINENIGSEICISSNGLATDRIERLMKEILKLKAKVRVMISIDGIGERHDEVRGVPGAFSRATATVEALKIMGLKDIGLAYLSTNQNVDQLMEVMNLSRKIKVDFTVVGTANSSKIALSPNNPQIDNLEELRRQYQRYVREQLKSYSVNKWGRAYYNSGTPYYAETGKRQIPCFAGSDFFFMTPNGDIYPDMVLDYKLGNIGSQPFAAIWHSQKAEEFRKSIAEDGYCSTPCWMICTVSPWMKKHKVRCAMWLVENKLRAHLGLTIKPVQ